MTFEEIYVMSRGIIRVMLDSEQTAEIHIAEEITGRGFYKNIHSQLLQSDEGAQLLKHRPELCDDQVDYDFLRTLSPTTLGGAYVQHLDSNNLSAEYQAAETTYVDDPDISYLMRRFRQTHDVWHALLELGTAGHEEVIIHAFSWGQLQLPVSAMVVVFGTLKHIIGEGRWGALMFGLLEAYNIGREAKSLLPVHWEKQWQEPIETVRLNYNLRTCTQDYVHG